MKINESANSNIRKDALPNVFIVTLEGSILHEKINILGVLQRSADTGLIVVWANHPYPSASPLGGSSKFGEKLESFVHHLVISYFEVYFFVIRDLGSSSDIRCTLR